MIRKKLTTGEFNLISQSETLVEIRDNKPLYYECHITVEPVFNEQLIQFQNLSSSFKFKVAELLLQKRKTDSEVRSSKDSFCTSQGKNYNELFTRMESLVTALKNNNLQVWRSKIEAVLYDNREYAKNEKI